VLALPAVSGSGCRVEQALIAFAFALMDGLGDALVGPADLPAASAPARLAGGIGLYATWSAGHPGRQGAAAPDGVVAGECWRGHLLRYGGPRHLGAGSGYPAALSGWSRCGRHARVGRRIVQHPACSARPVLAAFGVLDHGGTRLARVGWGSTQRSGVGLASLVVAGPRRLSPILGRPRLAAAAALVATAAAATYRWGGDARSTSEPTACHWT